MNIREIVENAPESATGYYKDIDSFTSIDAGYLDLELLKRIIALQDELERYRALTKVSIAGDRAGVNTDEIKDQLCKP